VDIKKKYINENIVWTIL